MSHLLDLLVDILDPMTLMEKTSLCQWWVSLPTVLQTYWLFAYSCLWGFAVCFISVRQQSLHLTNYCKVTFWYIKYCSKCNLFLRWCHSPICVVIFILNLCSADSVLFTPSSWLDRQRLQVQDTRQIIVLPCLNSIPLPLHRNTSYSYFCLLTCSFSHW